LLRCQWQTGAAVFDLTSKIPEILGNNTKSRGDFGSELYTTQADAQSGTNAIVNPSTYTNLPTANYGVQNNATVAVNSTGVFQIQ
jgi:hypothetical protein